MTTNAFDDAYGLIIAGGGGTRLWPLSRANKPKQLTAIPGHGEETLLQRTFNRLARNLPPHRVFVVTSADYSDKVLSQLREICPDLPLQNILAEPQKRGTAPALYWGLRAIRAQNPQAKVVVVWSDQIVRNRKAFNQGIAKALAHTDQGQLVALGVKATRFEGGLGYFAPHEEVAPGVYTISELIEKPTLEFQPQLQAGNYYWNAGIFAASAQALIDTLETKEPDFLRLFETHGITGACLGVNAQPPLKALYEELPERTLEQCLLIQLDQVLLIPAELDWADFGTFDVIYRKSDRDEDGNVLHGNTQVINTRNSLVLGNKRLVTTVGVANLVVVDTEDALLICDMRHTQDVRHLVAALTAQKRTETEDFTTVTRPWGSFTVLHEGDDFKVKVIEVQPHNKLSLQMHHHRAEEWIILNGRITVTIGQDEIEAGPNVHLHIPLGTRHRIDNRSDEPARLIEVQHGTYLGEDDIVRFEDQYGRA